MLDLPADLTLPANLQGSAYIAFAQPTPTPNPTSPTAATPSRPEQPALAGDKERPWRVSFSFGAEYALPADLRTTTGDVSIGRVGASVGLDIPVGQMSGLAFSLASVRSWYEWDDATSLGGTSVPWDDTTELDFGARFYSRIDASWSWFAAVGVNSSGEDGAEFSDTLTYGGGLGGRYRVDDTLSFTFGAFVRSQLEESASFFPIFGVDWKFAEKWSLTTDYRTSVFPRPGLFVRYQATEKLALSLGGSYESHVYRLSDRDAPIEGIGRERRVPIEFGAEWKAADHVTLNVSAGVVVWQRFRLDDSTGTRIQQVEADPTAIFNLNVKLEF